MEDYIGESNNATAVDSDWLEITYTKRKYVDKKPKKVKKSGKRRIIALSLVAVVLCLAVGLVVTDVVTGGEFIKTAQTFLTSTFFNQTQDISNTIVVPAWWEVDVVEEGKITFSGCSLALSLSQGEVTAVGENSVSVSVDENTTFVYDNLSEIYVNVGDKVQNYQVLGDSISPTLTVYFNQQVVLNVVANGTEVSWTV